MQDWGKVFIGTRYQPYLPALSCEALIGLVQFGMRAGDRRDAVYSKTMHKAANTLARKFLESDCDALCFIDSDAVFGTNALEELRADPEGWEYDVLQAFTVKRGWPPEPMFLTLQPEQPHSDERLRGLHLETNLPLDPDHIYPVDSVSLHFTLIRRRVFERLLEPEGPRFTFWFEYSRDNGEDVTFSAHARTVGARMGMTTRLKVGHVSDVVTGWDTMVDYYDRQFAYAEGAPPASMERIAKYFEAQHKLSALVAEYTGEDVETVYAKASSGIAPIHDQWRIQQPTTPDEVRAFYGRTPQYLYGLVKWNATPAYQAILGRLRGVRGEKILEFGGGLGTTAEFLATQGNRIHYYDVPGVLRDFAAWRFERLHPYWDSHSPSKNGDLSYRPIELIERWEIADGNGAGYDRVVAIDVLEHLHPDEFESVVDGLVSAIKPGGILFAHNNWEKKDNPYPSHFDHAALWEKLVARHGLIQMDDLTFKKPEGEQ